MSRDDEISLEAVPEIGAAFVAGEQTFTIGEVMSLKDYPGVGLAFTIRWLGTCAVCGQGYEFLTKNHSRKFIRECRAHADISDRDVQLAQELRHIHALATANRERALRDAAPAREAKPAMTPLETTWRGYRFRSRTEARWGVALTHARIDFEYESEGFALPSGWYLPDFWLPERKHWIEVKGQAPNAREIALASELASQSGHWVLFAVGAPDPDKYEMPLAGGGPFTSRTNFELPMGAYEAARAERFDGKPNTAGRGRGNYELPSKRARPPRWY